MLAGGLSTWGQGRDLEVSMEIPWAGTTPASGCQLTPSHWTRSVEKYSPDPLYLSKRFETSEGEGGVGTQIAAPLQIDLRRSAWICKDSLINKMLNDPLRSARIRMDSQQEQQLIWKGSYKPQLVICYNPAKSNNSQTCKQGTISAKGRHQTPATTPHQVTCALGLVTRWSHKKTTCN